MKKYLILLSLVALVGAGVAYACCGPYCQYPVINDVTADPVVLWPPNHKYVEITVAADVSWVDADGPGTVTIVSVSSSQPDNAPDPPDPRQGDGDTVDDIVITGDLTVDARAERAGNDPDGRTYTIVVEARQAPPCETYARYASVTVFVPHDQGKKK